MRVIAGQYRSRIIEAPIGMATRPTSDRLRETLFNILSTRIAGSVFADLYSGSGAVGIEAISRSARLVYFAENAKPAITALRANLAALKITAGFSINQNSVSALLETLRERGSKLDLVYLDPPYEAAAEYTATLGFLGRHSASILSADALVIAEHARRTPPAATYGNLVRTRIREQGTAALSFYAIAANQSPSE